ncbi:MAG: VWA domain-containing protein [Candidatus Zixiibacteriota bacterium]
MSLVNLARWAALAAPRCLIILTILAVLAGPALAGPIMGPEDDPYEMIENRVEKVPEDAAKSVAVNPLANDVTITQIDPSGFPYICSYVTITGPTGYPLGGLDDDSICVWQDTNKIDSFSVVQTPVDSCITSICLVIDVSGSMSSGGKLTAAKNAAKNLVRHMDQYDRMAIVKFSSCYSVEQVFTSDTTVLINKINALSAGGFTAALDGIWAGTNLTIPEFGSKAVIALSDGMENNSENCGAPPDGLDDGFADDSALIVNLALGAGIPIYSIALGTSFDPQYLRGLANGSGGDYFHAPTGSQLDSIYNEIKLRLCSRYLICYTSPDTIRNGDCHDVIICRHNADGTCTPCDTGNYCEPFPPVITIDVDTVCRRWETPLPICATVTDSDTPPQDLIVRLFYRIGAVGSYADVPMSRSGNTFCYTIPAAMIPCGTDEVDFYITASDGQSTVASPPNAPVGHHTIYICPNHPPVCNLPNDTTITLCDGDTTVCFPYSKPYDPDLNLAHCSVRLLSGPKDAKCTDEVCFTAPIFEGTYVVELTCVDSCGLTCADTFRVTFDINDPPVCTAPNDTAIYLCAPAEICLPVISTDPNGDLLRCEVVAGPGQVDNGQWCYTPSGDETVRVTIRCTDPCGAYCETSFTVTVNINEPPVCGAPDCDSVKLSGHFTMAFGGASYDPSAGTSTWCYTIIWDGTAPALSHLIIELCSELNAGNLVSSTPAGATIGADGSTGLYGIKWDTPNGIPANTPVQFCFTINRVLAVEQSDFAPKAGSNIGIATICGASVLCQPPVPLFTDTTIAMCSPTEVCLPLGPVGDPDGNLEGCELISGPGKLVNGQWCYTPTGNDTVQVVVRCVDECGAYCERRFRVIFKVNLPPVCEFRTPAPPQCTPPIFVVPFTSTDPEGQPTNCVLYGPGSINGNVYQYIPTGGETIHVIIRCYDECDSCEIAFEVTFPVKQPPLCIVPNDTTIFQCQPAEVCLPVKATSINPPTICEVISGPGRIVDSTWCYTPTGDETATVTVRCLDFCEDSCVATFSVKFVINDDPVCVLPNDTTIFLCEPQEVCLPVYATDANGNLRECSLVASPGTFVNGQWCYTPKGDETVEVNVLCVDSCGAECRGLFRVHFMVNRPPVCGMPNDTSFFLCDPDTTIRFDWLSDDPDGNLAHCEHRFLSGPVEKSWSNAWIFFPPIPPGVYVLQDSCIDSCGAICVDTMTVTIQVNHPPVCHMPGDTTVFVCGPDTVCIPFYSTDEDGNLAYCTFDTKGVPPGFLQGYQLCGYDLPPGPYEVPIVCYDSCGAVCRDTIRFTIVRNDPPECHVPNDTLIFQCKPEEICLPVFGTDPNGNLVSCRLLNGPGTLANGLWCYTPTGDEDVSVTVGCVDSCGAVCEKTFRVRINLNEPPTCTVPNDTTIFLCEPGEVCLPFSSDDADGNFYYCEIVAGSCEPCKDPNGCKTGGQGAWCCYIDHDTTIVVTIRCYDDCGEYCEKTFTVNVRLNRPPVCDMPRDTTLFLCDADTTVCFSADSPYDPDGNMATCQIRLLSAPTKNSTVEGIRICFNPPIVEGTYVIEELCIDSCGAVCADTFTVTFNVNDPPVITCPPDLTFDCDSIGDFGWPTATDDQPDPNITLVSRDSVPSGDCPQAYRLVLNYVASDECNAIDRCQQVITVVDRTAPVVVCPDPLLYECDEVPTVFPMPTVTDNCDPQPTLKEIGRASSTTIECPQGYHLTIMWEAMDHCGNADTCTQVINVVDTTPPQLTCPPDTLVECDDLQEVEALKNVRLGADPFKGDGYDYRFGRPQVKDNCDPEPLYGLVNIYPIEQGDCPYRLAYRLVFLSKDHCGNISDSCFQTVWVTDTTPPLIVCPPDTTIECDDLPAGFDAKIPVPGFPFGTPTARDNCDPDPWIHIVDVQPGGEFPCKAYYRIGYVATDTCGNTSEPCWQTVYIVDTTPPAITCPPDTLVECDELPTVNIQKGGGPSPFGWPTAEDNCDNDPRIEIVSVERGGEPPCRYFIRLGFQAFDLCENASDTCFQRIFVVDTTPPELTCPPDTVIECDEFTQGQLDALKAIPPGKGLENAVVQFPFGEPIVRDNCDPEPLAGIVGAYVTDTSRCHYVVRLVYLAADHCQNYSDTCSQAVIIVDTTAPQIVCPPDTLVECDELIHVQALKDMKPGDFPGYDFRFGRPRANDNCDPEPLVALVNMYPVEQGNCPFRLALRMVFQAADHCGNISDSCYQMIIVTDTTPPRIVCPPDTLIECDDIAGKNLVVNVGDVVSPFGWPTAVDNCDPDPWIHIVDVQQGGEPPCQLTLRIAYMATDTCGNNSEICWQSVTVVDTTPPQIVCPPDTVIECDDLPRADIDALKSRTADQALKGGDPNFPFGTPTVTDNCDPEPFAGWFFAGVDDKDPCYIIFSFGYLAVDHCRNFSDTCYQRVIVVDTTPPEITCPPDTTIECSTWDGTKTLESFKTSKSCLSSDPGSTPCGWPTATDNCDPNPGICFVKMRVNTNDPCDVIIQLGFIATDWCRNVSDTCWQTIHVVDTTPPVVTCPPDTTIECDELPELKVGGESPFGQPTVVDNCDPNPVVELVGVEQGGEFPCKAFIRIGFSAYDRCENHSDTCWQTVYIVDTTPPAITCPPDTVISCDEYNPQPPQKGDGQSPFGWPTAEDNCDNEPRIELVSVQAGGLPCRVFYHLGYQAVDKCGNWSDTCWQTAIIVDSTPPELTCPPDTVISCDEIPETKLAAVKAVRPGKGLENALLQFPFGEPIVTDNCDPEPLAGIVGAYVTDTSLCHYVVRIVYLAADHCENFSDTCSQAVTIVDTTPPILTCPPDTLVNCDDLQRVESVMNLKGDEYDFRFGRPTAIDNCDQEPLIALANMYVLEQGDCPYDRAVRLVFLAADHCGNVSDSCYQTIRVVDTTKPVVVCPPDTLIECDEVPDAKSLKGLATNGFYFGTPTATDNCDPDPWIHIVDVQQEGEFPCQAILRIAYVATDTCGNTSEPCWQTIQVVDTTPPVITCPPDTVISCDERLGGDAKSLLAMKRSVRSDALKGGHEYDYRFGRPSVTDNCDPEPIYALVNVYPLEESPCRSVIRLVFQAADHCQNISDSCYQNLIIVDTVPPQITCPPDTLVECDEIPSGKDLQTVTNNWPFGTPTAKDNCDPQPQIVLGRVEEGGQYPCAAWLRIGFLAIDACGLKSDTCWQTIRIVDTTPPVITCPPDTSFYCGDIEALNKIKALKAQDVRSATKTVDGPFGTPIVIDNCDPEPLWAIVNAYPIQIEECPIIYRIVYMAADHCENLSDSCYQDVSFNDTTPPICHVPPDTSIFVCDPTVPICLPVWAEDDCGTAECRLVEGPGELVEDKWCFTPTSMPASVSVTVACVDQCDNECRGTFTVKFRYNQKPFIQLPPDQTITLCEPDTICFGPIPEFDLDHNGAFDRTNIGWVDDRTDRFCFVPDTGGVYTIIVCLVDSCGAEACDTMHVTVRLNHPPVCHLPNDTTIFMCEPHEVCLPAGATDEDGNLMYCRLLGQSPGSYNNGLWCYTPKGNETVEVEFGCIDSCEARCEGKFTVTFVMNQPPICQVPNDTVIFLCEPTLICLPYGAIDPEQGPVRCGIVTGTPGKSFGNEWCFDAEADTSLTVTIRCEDTCGATCEKSFHVVIDVSEPPVCPPVNDTTIVLCDPVEVCIPVGVVGTIPPASAVPITTPGLSPIGGNNSKTMHRPSSPGGASVGTSSGSLEAGTPSWCQVISGPGVLSGGYWCWTPPDHDTTVVVTIQCTNECKQTCEEDFTVHFDINEPPTCNFQQTTPPVCTPPVDFVAFTSTDPEGGATECTLYGPGELIPGGWQYVSPTPGTTAIVTIVCYDDCGDSCVIHFERVYPQPQPAECHVPNDTTIFLCTLKTDSLPVSGGSEEAHCRILTGPGVIRNGFWVYTPTGEQTVNVSVRCASLCDSCDGRFSVTYVVNDAPICQVPRDTTIRLCEPTEVCLNYGATDADGNLLYCQILGEDKGEGGQGQWCFFTDHDTTVSVTVRCEDDCGAVCEKTFQATFEINDAPSCNVPRDTTIFQCVAAQVCLPVSGTDPNGNFERCSITSGPGTLSGGNWCYTPTGDGVANVTIQCEDSCGAVCTKTFHVTFDINDGPVCNVPHDTTIFQCTPTQVCLPVSATDVNNNLTGCRIMTGPGQLIDGNWCYTPSGDQTVTVTIRCTDACGAVCEKTFHVTFNINDAPICQLGEFTQPSCTTTVMFVPITATDPEQGAVTCELAAGPGQMVPGGWQYTPVPGQNFSVTIRCRDVCGAICETQFSVAVPQCAPPICDLPSDTLIRLCTLTQVCLPVQASGQNPPITCAVVSGPGQISGGNWCYTPTGAGTANVTIRCTDALGSFCEGSFQVQFVTNTAPTCTVWPRDTTIVLCQWPSQICLPVAGTDVDGNFRSCRVVSGPGSIVGGNWCYTPPNENEIVVTIRCEDSCNAYCEKTFRVQPYQNDPPSFRLPEDTTVSTCGSQQICIPITFRDDEGNFTGAQVISGPGQMNGNSWCYTATGSTTFNVTIRATDGCGATAQRTMTVIINWVSSPTCDLPDNRTYILCQAGTLCLPTWSTGPAPIGVTCTVQDGPGYISGNYWCYYASANTTVNITIRCTNACGEVCTTSRTYKIEIDPADCQGGAAGADFTPGPAPEMAAALPGDVDHSGVVDLVDLAKLMHYLRRSNTGIKTGTGAVRSASLPDRGIFDLQAADVNCDGTVNDADADYLSSYLFDSGKAPCADQAKSTTPPVKSPTRVGGSSAGN